MQTEFNFNNPLPFRQQAVARHGYRAATPRREPSSHGCHVFCYECFSRIFLGSAAFKLYLLVAWCIGLSGLMYLQKPLPPDETRERENEKALHMVIMLMYLVSQVFGLLAAVTRYEKIFIPYVIILFIVSVCNTICLSWAILAVVYKVLFTSPIALPWNLDPLAFFVLTLAFFCYNMLCLCSVMHLCQRFDQKRLIAERRRRELLAHNTRVYERLVRLHPSEQSAVVANADSPPKYSSLDSNSPPPGYSQLRGREDVGREEEEEEKKASCRRALFQEPPV